MKAHSLSGWSQRRERRRDGFRNAACLPAVIAGLVLVAGCMPLAAASFSEWAKVQSIESTNAGLVRLALPSEAFDAAQSSLADLRLADTSTNEIPFLIERPRPTARRVSADKNWQVFLEDGRTRVELELRFRGQLRAIGFESPAEQFLKSVSVSARAGDGGAQSLVAGQPIFRQPGGVTQLTVKLPDGRWPHLTILLDDQKSKPIPITGLQLHEEDAAAAPPEIVPSRLIERVEAPGETRLTVDLGASRLPLAGIRFESSEPLFTRRVRVLVRQWEEGEVRERALGDGTIFRIAVEGEPSATQLEFPLDAQPPGRELVLSIENGDSPPLAITGITFLRWPVRLVFLARSAGIHFLFSGNPRALQPRYDVAALGSQLGGLPVHVLQPGPMNANPNFRPVEPLPEVPLLGAAFNPGAWLYRRPVKTSGTDIQQLELPPHVLAHAQPGLADLRIAASGKQVPFILERTSFSRSLPPEVTKSDDPKQPTLSRWQLTLPHARLPITKLACAAKSPLFQREVRVFEQAPDTRGERYRRELGSAAWLRQPGRRSSQFSVTLHTAPLTDTVFLEIDNGDNPALELEQFQAFFPVNRLLFKAPTNANADLCYGNPKAVPPSYDLALVAVQMLAAPKSVAALVGSEPAAESPRVSAEAASWLFWSVLAIVVAGLLTVVTRLIPKTQADKGPETPES